MSASYLVEELAHGKYSASSSRDHSHHQHPHQHSGSVSCALRTRLRILTTTIIRMNKVSAVIYYMPVSRAGRCP